MDKTGPIIVIEDDEDDREMLAEIFEELKYDNEVIFFHDGSSALEYLDTSVKPFLILSDINMPIMDGFALRQKIHTNARLHVKCTPYLFFTTSADQKTVENAYALSVQGFFIKPNSYNQLKETIRKIMEYWKEGVSPSD